MKCTHAILTALCLILSPLSLASSSPQETPFPLTQGLNISHWLSQVYSEAPNHTQEYFTEDDVIFIKKSGFDHIRLPIDEIALWDENGHPIPETFTALQNCIQWTIKHDLRIIVDLHTVRSHHFNAVNDGTKNTLLTSPAAQEHFLNLWSQLSELLADTPIQSLAYEPLNEVVADNHEDWNKLLARTIQQIRINEPNRVIIVGSNRWQQPGTMPYLKVPENDPNLILSFHFYSPFLFTHYKTKWTPLKDYQGPTQYPGIPYTEALPQDAPKRLKQFVSDMNTPYTQATMLEEITPAIKKAQATGLRLYCGEFGCFKTVPREMLLQWYKDITTTLKAQKISYTAWDYQDAFGIKDRKSGTIDTELLDILTQ